MTASPPLRAMALVLVLALAAPARAVPISSAEHKESWSAWVEEHRKEYKTDEVASRYAIFGRNLALIKRHNEEALAGKHSYEVALNEFADLTWEEFSASRLGYTPASPKRQAPGTHIMSNLTLPAAIDWREKGAVLPAKNQGACGSCWAFSAVCALEGAHFRATGQLISLSEQQLVDCSKDWSADTDLDNYGCNGGLMDNAFAYWLNSSHGDDTETAYPYKGRDGKCAFKAAALGASISSYKDVPADDEDALQDAVASVGPISVAIHAGPMLQFYFRGVFNGVLGMCPGPLNHGVTAVGYGTAAATRTRKELDYWIIKNSWGGMWGEKGFFRMARGRNLCGVAKDASYPIV